MAAFSLRTTWMCPVRWRSPCMPVARRDSLHQRSCPAPEPRRRLLCPAARAHRASPGPPGHKHGIGRIPLRKNQLSLRGLQRRLALTNFGKKGLGVERCGSCFGCGAFHFLVRKEPTDSVCFCSRSPCIFFILTPGSLRSLCSHGQQHYSIACPSASQAVPTFDRTRPQHVEPLPG